MPVRLARVQRPLPAGLDCRERSGGAFGPDIGRYYPAASDIDVGQERQTVPSPNELDVFLPGFGSVGDRLAGREVAGSSPKCLGVR